MMENNKNKLYNALKQEGYDNFKDINDFNSYVESPSNRKKLYDALKQEGYDNFKDEFEFNAYLGYNDNPPESLRRPEAPVGGYIQPQQSVNSNSLQETPDYASLIEAGQKRMQEYSGEVLPTDAVSNSIPSTSAYQPKIENARLVDVGRSIEEKMIDSQVERIGKLSNTSDKNILENYNNRYAMTDEGSILRDSIEKRRMEVSDRLAKDYLASDLYKELSSRYTGKELDAKANEEFDRVYGGRIEEELAPVYNEYRDKMLHRYGDNIQSELTELAKNNTENQVASLKEEVKQGLEAAYGEWNSKQAEYESKHPFMAGMSNMRGGMNARMASLPLDDKKFSNWYSAMNLLDGSEKMIVEAKKKGAPGALLRGVRDGVFDVDAWTSGITDMIHGSSLKIAVEKSERGETLTREEEKLLEAAAVNMATNAYFASDLSRSYKAGQTAGGSIPFTLGFLFNPVSGSGNAIAKGILKYGAKRFGLNALKGPVVRNGLKMGSRLIGDAVAATAMTTTTGIGKVAAGANERMIGDVKFDFSEDGKIGYAGRENQMGVIEAFGKSTASNTIENFSEMFFNAFNGGGKIFGNYLKKAIPGIEHMSSSELGILYNGIKNNAFFRDLAKRTQFHGLLEEHLEEVVGSIMNIPLGESSWKETFDLDNNLDILCGLAPMSIFMGAVGAGGFVVENRRIRKNLNRLSEGMTPEQKAMLDNAVEQTKDMGNQDVRNSMKAALLNKGLTEAQKRTHIEYLYNKLQEKAAKAAREKETEDAIQKETDDIVNSSNQADGTVTECSRIMTNEIGETVLVPGHIVGWMGGTIIENEDGTKSREGGQPIWQAVGSKERTTLHEGEFDPESIKSMPVQDMMDATAEMMREEAQKKAEMESKYDLSRINPPSGGTTFTDISGRQITIIDKNPNDPGNGWIVRAPVLDEKGNPKKDGAGNMLEENFPITNEDYYDTMQAQLDAQEEVANIQDKSSNLSENQVKDEILPPAGENIMSPYEVSDAIAEVNPTTEPIQEPNANILASESTVIYKKDKAGNDTDEVDFENMPIENSINYLNDLTGDIDATYKSVGKTLKKASEHLVSIQEKVSKIESEGVDYTDKKEVNAYNKAKLELAEAQKKVDYWNSINEEIAASHVQPGDKTAEAILSMGEPMNGEELAAMMLGTGRLPILYDSYKKETGGRNAEARGMVGLFATKANGGLSIEEAGEQLMLADQENGTHFFDKNDPNAGRNAIIDVLSGARTRGDLFGFIQRNREALAERERQAELEAYEQTIARLAEASHMTPEEFIAFEENISQMLEERLKDIPDEELKSIFAELYLDENYGRSRKSDEVGTGVPKGEGRAESNEGSPGVLSEERGDNAGASEYSQERPELDDEIGQSGDGVLSEADAVDGREEVASIGSYDRQGNPIDEHGNLIIERIDSIEQLTDEDFNTPSRSVQLPLIPTNVSEAIGAGSKPVIIKKNIFEKNRNTHKELTPEKSRNILVGALYSPNLIGQVQPIKRPNYWVAIETTDKNSVVVLEVNNKKDNVEIVGWRLVDTKGLEKMKRQAEREGGQFLIQTSTNDAAAALSTLPSGLSSESKDSKLSNNKQENAGFVSPLRAEGEPILDYAARVVESKYVHDAGSEVDTNPTEAQKEAGNYKKGHVKIDGFDITIENPKGSVRSGVDADGKPWSVTMNNTYGYIRGTEGVDGDHIDVFLGDSGNKVYVVDQLNTKTGAFDEHKVMYGFNSTDEAAEAYLSNYSPGWQGLGAISEVSKETFKKWIDSSHRKTKPFVEYKIVKERVLSEPEYIQSQVDLAFSNRNNQAQTKEEWENTDNGIKAYNNASDSYSSYLKHLSDSGNLQRIYDSSNIGDKIRIRENIETAGFEVNDLVDTTKEKAEAKKKREEKKAKKSAETMRKLGLLSSDLEGGIRFRVVHHGSGASFGKFSTEFIDTGEGNQSFGWGLYFTDKKDIAQYYAETIGGMPSYVLYKNGQRANMDEQISRIIYNFDGSVKKAIASNKKTLKNLEKEGDEEFAFESRKIISELEKEDPKAWKLKEEGNRYLYDVEIPDTGFLHWDKAVADEQKRQIIQQANKEGLSFSFYGDIVTPEEYFQKNQPEGFQVYKMLSKILGGDKEASMFLNRSGFNGIEYAAGRHSGNTKLPDSNFVVFDENAVRIINHLRYRLDGRRIEEVNERFNEELSRYKDGRMKSNEMFHLGTPQGAMLAFLPDLPIVMRQKTIRKGTEKKHNVDVDMLKDMPAMIASPIFVFQRDVKKMGILTEMIDRDGKNVCVAIEMNKTIQNGTNILEVNEIRSFHGREVENIIKPIRDNGTLKWVDKEKGLDWITSALHNFKQAQSDQNLSTEVFSSATKIVESFENPTIEQGKIVSEVESLADNLHTPVRIVKSTAELPEGDVVRKRIENGDGIKGWFDTKSEEMAIYLPNATSGEDARESVFHEVVGHYGLRKLFGEDFNTFLDNVYANVSPEIRKQIVIRAKERGNILDLREATEEYLAALAERGFDSVEERTLWQKIKDAFIDMLRKAGVHLGFDLTDNELRYILWRSYQNLKGGNGILEQAQDIAFQMELGVGRFRKEEDAELHYSELKKEADRLKELTGRDVNLGRNEEEIAFMMSNDGADAGTIDHVRDTFARAREEGKKFFGFFDADTGKVYLCADQIKDINQLRGKWIHEISHQITSQFSDQELAKLYDKVGVDEIEDFIGDFYRDLPKERKVDEYLSIAVEEIVTDTESFDELMKGKGVDEVLEHWEYPKIMTPYISTYLKNTFYGKEKNEKILGNDRRGEKREDELRLSGDVRTSSKESTQGETERRFRTGEPTGEERRESGKVDKSTLSLNDSAFRMSKWEKIREAYQDGMISVKLMQDYLAQKTGKAIPEWMDVYLYENSKSGRSGYRMEQFHKKLYAPLMQEAGRLMQKDRNNGSSVEEAARLLDVYMKAKHGLEERNERMRREAMLKKINSIKDEDAKSVALQEMGESGIQDIVFSDESLEKFRVNLLLKDYSGLIGLAGKDENGNDKSMPEAERYAREAISTYEANHDTKKLWELVKDVSEYALKEEYEGGLIDRETYEAIRDMYKYYIPLRGRSEKTAEDFFSYIERGASDTGFENVIKKAYGHTYESGNAFAYLAKMAETAIVQSEKNRVKQRLLWMARNYRDPSIMEIANVWYVKDSEGQWVEKVPELAGTEGEQKQAMIEFNQQMEELQKEGKAKRKLGKVDIGVPISTYQAQEHQVRVKENGREYVININADPRIARAINGHSEELNRLVRFIDSSVRYIAAINTSYSLEFGSGNIIRDGEYALGSSFTKEGIRYAAKGAKNTVPAVAAMQRYFRGKQDMSNQMDKYLQEFLESGGETGFTHLSNLNLHEKRAKKMLKRASRGKKLRTGENIINQANRFLEMIPRFTTYVTSRESGKSIMSSVNDAKNITVNFNRRGSGRMADWETDGLIVAAATSIAPVLSRLQAYSNAGIQGVANFFGSAKDNPARFAMTTASVTAIGVLSAIISNMLGGDDEPGYEDIPEWVRHSNFTLFNGKDYFALPLTMEYRPFYTLGESMAMAYLGKSDMKKAAKSIGQSMWDNWNPISPEIFKSGSPTPFLTPIYENMRDEDFKESKITGRTSWNAYLPEYQRAKKGTGDVFMWVSEGLNDVTGGNKYERGWAQVNPSQLEHLVMGWSGGVGKAVSGLYGIVKNTIAGEKTEPERIPIVRRFYGKVTEENRYRRLKKEFKEKVTEADNLMKSLKRMQKDYENPLDYAARINEIYKDGEYEKAYNLIEDNKTLRDYEAYYNGSETQEDADYVMKSMIDILEEALKE